MTCPDMTICLIGALLKDKYAIIADIGQVLLNFYVHENDRYFLRFLWFKDNNIDNELVKIKFNSVSTYLAIRHPQ